MTRNAIAAALALTLVATPALAAQAEKPLAPETHPPGDIPDSQVFVEFAAPFGVAMKVPEGWSRREAKDSATFADKFGTVSISVAPASAAPTVASVKADEAKALVAAGRAVTISRVAAVALPAGPAVEIVYGENSAPDAVPGKRIRLEKERFLVQRGGRRATLTFAAPAGADNVDQWKLMRESLQWR